MGRLGVTVDDGMRIVAIDTFDMLIGVVDGLGKIVNALIVLDEMTAGFVELFDKVGFGDKSIMTV